MRAIAGLVCSTHEQPRQLLYPYGRASAAPPAPATGLPASGAIKVEEDLGFLPVVVVAISALDGYAMAAAISAGSGITDPGESDAAKQLWRWKREVEDRWFNVNKYPKVELSQLLQQVVATANEILSRSVEVKQHLSPPWQEQVANYENNVQRDRDVFNEFLSSVLGVNDSLVSDGNVPDLIGQISNFVIDVRALMGVLEYAAANDVLQGGFGGVITAFVGLCYAVADLFNAIAVFIKAVLDVAASLVRAGAAVVKTSVAFLPYVVYGALAVGLGYLGWEVYKYWRKK